MFGLFSKKKKKSAKPAKKGTAKKADPKKAAPKKATTKSKSGGAKPAAAPTVSGAANLDVLSDEALIREAVGAAETEIGSEAPQTRKPPIRRRPDADGPETEREKIIQQALAIQRAKSPLLDNLDPQMKAKIQKLAIEMMSQPNRKPDA
jgi:hypothetical protein